MNELLSIEEISRRTGLEESLLRFYESEYPAELPEKILHGDRFVFGAGAIEAFLRLHAKHQAATTESVETQAAGSYARVIAVTSGKGGVGKTNIALNLAIELQRLGKMCPGARCRHGHGQCPSAIRPAAQARHHEGGQRFAAAVRDYHGRAGGDRPHPWGSGTVALADADRQTRMKIIRALEEIERRADIIVVDTGAGMGSGVRDFLISADELLFVLTPDLTSLADAYGLLKALHGENLSQRPLYSVVNMVETLRQAADVAQRFSLCAHQFLDRRVESIGYLLKDSSVGAATARRTPYAVFNPHSRISKNTRNIAISLVKNEQPELRLSSAFGRYRNLLRSDAYTKLQNDHRR